MKKRILSLVLLFCISASLILVFPINAGAATSGTCGDNLTWVLDDEGILTISGSGDMTSWNYSSSAPWYQIRSSVKSVVIEDGVASIGDYAFYNCISLESIIIPNSVTSIGDCAFSGCTGLKSITIPNSATSIGNYAFSSCTGLESITIPNSVTSIGYYAFSHCGGLKSITIPNSVTSIGVEAFSHCTGLESITIPDSVTSIGYATFSYCSGLKSITIPNSVTSIGIDAFSYCTGLESITIPDSVTTISVRVFSYCSALKSITIPNSVTSIGGSAFRDCHSLSSITIPDSVTSIGYYAFYNCISLESITIPDSVTGIGESAFSHCSALKSITIPDSVTSIDIDTFSHCTGLESITIPDSVTSIGYYAFYNCISLESITIPDSVTGIVESAFSHCTGLESITIPDSVTSIGESAFESCTSLTSITIPDSVTSIGESAFRDCHSLSSITIPDSVTSIGDDAFYYCTGLESITISDSVTSIGRATFYYCTSLESITIPDSVTRVGSSAFFDCTNLKYIAISDSVTSIDYATFSGCISLESITIPDSVTSIGERAFSMCGGLKSITIPNSVTSIGERAFSYCSALKSITIPDSVTSIGEKVFLGCQNLERVDISNISAWCKIRFIGDYSNPLMYPRLHKLYLNSVLITDLIIPNSVTSIGDYAFSYCIDLKSITIPNSVTSIGDYAFSYCTGLESITIPNSVTSIGDYAFSYCTGLESITIPDSVAGIGDFAFSYCTGLKSITIPNSVTSIGDYAFYRCTGLKSITIPNSVRSIGIGAFNSCTGLESITIPDSVTSIGIGVFNSCYSLSDVYYAGTEEEWNNISIGSYNDCLRNATIHYNYTGEGSGSGSGNGNYGDGEDFQQSYFAEIKYNGAKYDLLSQPINIDKDSSAEVSVKVNYEDGTGNEKIYICQNAEKSVELENNTYKTFRPADAFDEDKDIYILIVNEKTGYSLSEKTRLKITDGMASGEWFPETDVEGLNFKLGRETGFTIPDAVPVFGGTEIKWDFDIIPISVEYDKEDNNKINIVFGFNVAHSDSKDGDKWFKDFDFKEFKKDVKKLKGDIRSYKQLRNDFKISNACKMNMFGGNVIGGGKGKSKYDVDVAGYAEAKIIDGKLTFIEGQICLNAEIKYNYQGQLFIWVVPVYYEIGGGIGAGFEGDFINVDGRTLKPEFFEAYLTAKIMANIGGGVGVAKVVTVGASGEGSLNLKTAIDKDYVKAWGEGEANFNVKVLGKEVAKKNFAKGDFLIYETGNANGWISDSAVKLASFEDENLYSGIDINKVYENESRSYASLPAKWHGDNPPISLMTAEYTNKNLHLLAENVYTESAPMMCTIGDKKVMVMLWDNSERDALNRTMIVYSVYDNETKLWSAPVPVCDDGTADFYPCFNDGYLVWQNEKSALDDSMTLGDIASLGEICVSKWNGTGFDEPVTITNNSAVDTQPFVCASGSEVSVVWTTNSENDIIGTSGSNAILKSGLRDSAWSEAVTVKDNLNSVVNLSAGYTDDGLNIAYVTDGDNDLQTINERDICIISENEECKLTDNDVLDSNPVFEGNVIYYYSNGNIEYAVLGSYTKSFVFDDMKAGLTDNFTVDTNEAGDVAIWWAKNTDSATEVFCTLYKDGKWSDEIQISDTGNQAKYPAGILEADGTMYVAYNNSILQDGDVVQSNLYTIDLLPSYDISVTDAYIDEDSMAVYATVKNSGELNVDSFTAILIDEGINCKKTFSEGLKAGESVEVQMEYIKPENLTKRTITFSVSIEEEEYNYDNDYVDLTVGSCDVNIAQVRNYEKLPVSVVDAVISNNGYSDTGKITVCLRKESADGTVAETQNIDNLSAGESVEVRFNYNIVENPDIRWYITAEGENEEISLGNNDSYFINTYLSSVSEFNYEILRYTAGENFLSVNAYAENNTGSTLSAVALLAVYDMQGSLKAFKSSDLAIESYGNASLNFMLDDYSCSNGDYMKMFIWNELSGLKPVCTPARADIFQ